VPDWWKELPDRDCEYVTYYPVDIRPISSAELVGGPSDGSHGFGIYIHIPICDKICPFCNYNKFAVGSGVPELVDSIERELLLLRSAVDDHVARVDFIYFGGGTPSVLGQQHLERIMTAVRGGFDVAGAEVCLECHPTHATIERLSAFREAGVNRISFGLQSLNDDTLTRIGSYHTRSDALGTVDVARTAGFDNVAIDMMFLLPGQTLEDWKEDLDEAVTLDADHVSTYRLALDPVGLLGRQVRSRRIAPQGEEQQELQMAEHALGALASHGYRHYGSCSSAGFDLARPGKESRYELLHRAAPQCEYAAVGPGAVGFMNGYTYWNIHTLEEYNRVTVAGEMPVLAGRRLTASDHQTRYAVLGVKHLSLPTGPFEELYGRRFADVFASKIEHLEDHGVARLVDGALEITPKGVHYMDNISKTFFNAENYRLPQPYKPELQLMSVDIHGHGSD
jgi:oxygen-independent coproporphyrinogen-3 oxidase